jgi:hypothetical protein
LKEEEEEGLGGAFVGLAYYQCKDIVFRFIVEYSRLNGFLACVET